MVFEEVGAQEMAAMTLVVIATLTLFLRYTSNQWKAHSNILRLQCDSRGDSKVAASSGGAQCTYIYT